MSDGSDYDYFGHSVSLSSNVAVIGAPYDDDIANDNGAAYVFERSNNGVWALAAKLKAIDAQGNVASSLWLKADHTVYDMLIDGVDPHKCIISYEPNLDVIASDASLHKAELILAGQPNREMVLKRVMQGVHDYI